MKIEKRATLALADVGYSYANLPPQSRPFNGQVVDGEENERMVNGILNIADALSVKYGSRPPYDGEQFSIGGFLTPAQAIYAAPFIIACESRNHSVKTLDSNNRFSYGIAQFQKATWDGFSIESGIVGDPMIKYDAVRMLIWGLENGKISHWSCSKILHIL